MYHWLAFFSGFAFIYSLIAGHVEKSPFSGPWIFITAGLIVGPGILGWVDFDVSNDEVRLLADLALALILFTDAANTNRRVLKRYSLLPLRMLLIGLPCAIAIGAYVGVVVLSLPLLYAAILATMLAATDAALGKSLFSIEAVPIKLRTALNVESGLNDGLCVPVLVILLSLAQSQQAEGVVDMGFALTVVARELGVGVLVGVILASLGYFLIRFSAIRGWLSEEWQRLPTTMLALMCFACAQQLHGSGYIAAFVGGLTFAHFSRNKTHDFTIETEGIGDTFAMLTWLIFGTMVLTQIQHIWHWTMLLYALLSLTLIRIVAVMLSLLGCHENYSARLYLSWFGPRGLASVVFSIIVLNSGIAHAEKLAAIVSLTVLLSALCHGISAVSFSRYIARK